MRFYEAAIPGRRVAGLPMNDAYFLPEDREDARVAPIDPADRETVARILAVEPSPEPRPPARPIRVASREEVDAHWHGAPATDDMYRGAVVLVDELAPFALGEQRGVVVRVANGGTHVWPPGGVGWPEIRVTYRWLDADGAVVVPDGLRTPLPAVLPPGDSLDRPGRRPRTSVAGAAHARPRPAARARALVRVPGVGIRWRCGPRSASRSSARTRRPRAAAAATLAEVAPSVRPLLLSASPERTTDLHGYRAAPDARAYVLDGGGGGTVRATAGALARAAALLGDAALLRAGARARLAAPRGTAYLDALH